MNSLNSNAFPETCNESSKNNEQSKPANKYCVELQEAVSISEQVAVVKKAYLVHGNDDEALQFLTDVYFNTPIKHPLRNQAQKLLINAAKTDGVNESRILTALGTTIQHLVEESKIVTDSSQWNTKIVSLTGCFDNFRSSVKALERNLQIVLNFSLTSVQKYLVEISVVVSPCVLNEYHSYIHNSIRFILACTREFTTVMKQQQQLYTNELKQLNGICKEIILDKEMPMDPRTNAGILMSYISKIFDSYERFIQEAKRAEHPNEIALCIGIINTFDYNDFMCHSLDIRDVCGTIEKIANECSTMPNILLSAARSLYHLSENLLEFDSLDLIGNINIAEDIKLILRKLLIFSFGYLEHHMDSVRHICKDLLRNIISLSKKASYDYLLQNIFDACNSERLSLSMKCVVLLQATTVLGATVVLSNCKEIFGRLIPEHLGHDFMVNNLFESLMCASHKELPCNEWQDVWIRYLLKIASFNDSRLPDIEILIVKAVKCESAIVQDIISSSNIPLSTKLSTLWAVRKSGVKVENFNQILQDFSHEIEIAIRSNCDETRIMALRLLVETHKTTEPLTELEHMHICTFLELNSNVQNPDIRQKSLSLLSKVIQRCELNLQRDLKKITNTTKTSKTSSTELDRGTPEIQDRKTSLSYDFLKDILRILVDNLFRGANFSRRSISLQLLEQALEVALKCVKDLTDLLPQKIVNTILGTLFDSYEANKEMAIKILKLIQRSHVLPLSYKEIVDMSELLDLLVSVRPLDSVTGAYKLEFYCEIVPANLFGAYEKTTYCPVYFSALRWLLKHLKEGLAIAKESILMAAKKNPLYGILFAMKHLFKRLDFKFLAADIAWRSLVAEVISLCKELTTVVAPIVNSDSPEGHLPNDFSKLPAEFNDPMQASFLGDGTDIDKNCKILTRKISPKNMNTVKVTPQMVLLCSWRTVKEVSLILGEIALLSPIQTTHQNVEHFLVTKDQILDIGEHFKQLLAETKHRGAFEQAYIGFSKLCLRLWRAEISDLYSLPLQWLRDLLSLITKNEQVNRKICSTRRSAGIPFMIQALITSELKVVGTTKSLHFCMTKLLELCSESKEITHNNVKSRTHAMNIMRALFRCADLNENVTEFIGDGIICAISGYDANDWSEKNSATLLFSALITRTFGVQRSRDTENLNVRNRMTGCIFFLRYPKLFDFFLNELKLASITITKRENPQKLHPLLLLLSRLYPSALEGIESNLKLSEFLPYISKCSACSEMQTRYLAAKATVALINKDAVHTLILKICAEILYSADDTTTLDLNLLHGKLLQILLLMKAHNTQNAELVGDVTCTLICFYKRFHLKNPVILKVVLDIFVIILSRVGSLNFPQETIENLLFLSMEKNLFSRELSYFYPVFRKSFFIYNIHVLRLILPYDALVDYLLNPPLTHSSISLEQAESCLDIILIILLHNQNYVEEFEEFELTKDEIDFKLHLSEPTLLAIGQELRRSKLLYDTMKEVIKRTVFYPECTMKAYAVLSQLDNFDFTLRNLIKESKRHPDDVKRSLALCVHRLAILNGIEFGESELCLDYLITEVAQPWRPLRLRLKACAILSHITKHYAKALERKVLSLVKAFISLVLLLLVDDDYEIRDKAAIIVLSMTENVSESCVPIAAQRIFLLYTANILKKINADENYIVDLFKIITETQEGSIQTVGMSNSRTTSQPDVASSSKHTIEADSEIFDKNEANVFAEPLKIISDSILIFKNVFSENEKVVEVLNDYAIS